MTPTINVRKRENKIMFYKGSYCYTRQDLASFSGFILLKHPNVTNSDEEKIRSLFPDKEITFRENMVNDKRRRIPNLRLGKKAFIRKS